MMRSEPITTALQGCLERHADGWYWTDGEYEPRVSDVTLERAAPAWPIVEDSDDVYVGIPHDFRIRIAPGETLLIGLIDALVREHGIPAAVPAEDLDEDTGLIGLQRHGWVVSLSVWQRELQRPHGARWNMEHEPELLNKARALGLPPSPPMID